MGEGQFPERPFSVNNPVLVSLELFPSAADRNCGVGQIQTYLHDKPAIDLSTYFVIRGQS
jgi:hypothetical protein